MTNWLTCALACRQIINRLIDGFLPGRSEVGPQHDLLPQLLPHIPHSMKLDLIDYYAERESTALWKHRNAQAERYPF